MSTTIDNLQIQIQTSSTNAAAGIRDLSTALAELKKSGTLTTVVKNLKGLAEALSSFASVSNAVSKISSLSTALTKLKGVGSLTTLVNSVKALPTALNSLSQIGDIASVEAKVKSIATALAPLSNIKSSGFTSAVNSLKKISEVTKSLDETTITEFTNKVKKLADALGPLSEKLTTVKSGLSGFNKAASEGGKGAKDLGLNIKAINFDAFTNVLQKTIGFINQLAEGIKKLISQAVQWDGIAARFGRGFGEQAEETYAWIKRLNEEMGINIQSFMQQSSIYATMLKGFGVANEDASKMALGYMELTYDIWAGYNDIYKTFEDAATAIRSAIAGEVEPIRKAGFTIVEATLEVTAANHGITKSLESMTEAEKSYLRYLTIIDQAYSQNLVGAYAQELNTAECLLRTLSQQTKSLAQAFGSLFLPLLVKAMPYVQAFVELLTELVHIVAEIFNVKIQKVDWSGYNEGADSIGDITDSANKAEEEVKALKNAMLGMDELNVIGDSTDTDGISSELDNAFANIDIASLWDTSTFEGINSQVKEITKSMREWLGITDDIDSWAELMDTRLGSILKSVGAITAAVGTIKVGVGLVKFVEYIDKLFVVLKNSKLLAGIAKMGVAVKETGGLWAALKAALQKVGSKLGWIGAIIVAVVAAIDFLVKHWKEFTQAIKAFWSENIAPKLEKIKEQFNGIKEIFQKLQPVIDKIKPAFEKIFEIIGFIVSSTSFAATMGLISSFLEWVEGIVQGLKGFFQTIEGIIDFIVALLDGKGGKTVDDACKKMVEGISNTFGGLYKSTIGPIVEWFKGV
ncbi:MAG: hypothetical protein IKV08_01655, partial [Phascolarctobacterium sp.]|nr:hypothetical protein [Phascolarctobacterium sp.]